MTRTPRVGGLDGCRRGWVLVTLPAWPTPLDPDDPGTVELAVVAHLADAADRTRRRTRPDGLALLCVDMPIGLAEAGPRACDVDARRRLGPRRASVFPAPVRGVLEATDHADANARHREIDGRGLSVQAWNLVPKIREVDAWITPADQRRVVETHPELAFAALADGVPLPHTKRTPAGQALRLDLLRPLVGDLLARPRPPGAAADDVLDAAALALCARDLAARAADDPPGPIAGLLRVAPTDTRGLRMAVAPPANLVGPPGGPPRDR